eukprot:c20911_g2_i2.p2 GENE.c20911_g2_i2~~c20911_g2_i2.p2  ORF type:complete len:357 (-),score=187.42 c20911_g2_i2:98-1168(-)
MINDGVLPDPSIISCDIFFYLCVKKMDKKNTKNEKNENDVKKKYEDEENEKKKIIKKEEEEDNKTKKNVNDTHVDNNNNSGGGKKAQWYVLLSPKFQNYLQLLETPVQTTTVTEALLRDPLFRCFNREAVAFADLIRDLKKNINTLQKIGEEMGNATAPQRALIGQLLKETIPKMFKRYIVPEMGFTEFIADLSKRITLMNSVMKSPKYLKNDGVWLGGLMSPEAWITATRQSVAQTKKVSLGDLTLVLQIDITTTADDCFVIKGLVVEGAMFKEGKLSPAVSVSSSVPPSRIRWVTHQEGKDLNIDNMMGIPVYLNNQRKELVFTALIAAPENVPHSVWFQRGIALILWDKKAEA